jgi:copper chaperone CopZ
MVISPVSIGSAPAPVRQSDAGCGCGGCGCGAAESTAAPETAVATESTVTTQTAAADQVEAGQSVTTTAYGVDGMTCGHCVKAVTEELSAVSGVSDVAVDLVVGGTSTVTVASAAPLDLADIRAALDEAGYELAGQV